MLHKCLFILTLLAVSSATYAQRSSRRSWDDDHYRFDIRKHNHDDDDNDHDQRAGRRRSGREQAEDVRERRRFSIVLPGRSGSWEVNRYSWSGPEERDFNRRRPSVPVFTFGPKVGVNYATLLKNPVALKTDYRLGYHIGGFMRFNLRRAYIQPEVLYSTKGGTLNLTQNSGALYQPAKYQVEINTLDVPLLLGARLVSTRSFNFRVFAGPMASFNLSGQGLDNFLNENESTRTYLANVLLAYQAGIGVDLGAITLDTRYEWSVPGIVNLQSAALGKPRSGLFQASVGIKMF